jgi:hypothetical protein
MVGGPKHTRARADTPHETSGGTCGHEQAQGKSRLALVMAIALAVRLVLDLYARRRALLTRRLDRF